MNKTKKEKEYSVDLRVQDLLMAYLRNWRVIVLCVIIAGTIGWGYTHFCVTDLYRSSATVYVSNAAETEIPDSLTSSDLSAALHLVKGYMILAESDTVLQKAADVLNAADESNRYTVGGLRSAVSTSQTNNTVIFNIVVSHKDRHKAQSIANAVAMVLVDEAPSVIKGTSAYIIDEARTPSSSYYPNETNSLTTGAGVGLLIALAYVTVMFLKDTRIKDENDLTDMFDLPILGRIPNFDDHITGARYVDPDIDVEKGGAEA